MAKFIQYKGYKILNDGLFFKVMFNSITCKRNVTSISEAKKYIESEVNKSWQTN